MSMTLEQAIEHAEQVAAEQSAKAKTIESNPWGEKNKVRSKIQDCLNCAEEHRQLTAWLRELQERRKEQYLTIEQIAAAVGSQTVYSARLWLEFARVLDCLGYAVVERRTDADD